MPRLTARYDVPLPRSCLVAIPDGTNIVATATIERFDVTVTLIPNMDQGTQLAGEPNFTRSLESAIVAVSGEEPDMPPTVLPDDKGIRDYSIQMPYFASRHPEYMRVAIEAANRVIRYFQFQLHTPLLREFSPGSFYFFFLNPTWTDSEGKVAGKSSSIVASQRTPGLRGELGVGRLLTTTATELSKYIDAPKEPNLVEQLLSDAQSAWFQNHLRRAVVELAIACEIAVKRKYFAAGSPAGDAFDYLEDKSRVSVRVMELVDTISKASFGRSFKDEQAKNYQNLDFLFRCRNKIVHRGELNFRDDAGAVKIPDQKMVADWWESANLLIRWIESL